MQPTHSFSWPKSELEAIQQQKILAAKVIDKNCSGTIKYIAGVDVAYCKNSETLFAAVVVIDSQTLSTVETVVVEDKVSFPYIPGLFSFRELPPIIKAFEQLKHQPQLVVCDGQGIAHPRRFGLACHLGVLMDVATIGCGKSRLCGEYSPVEDQRGAQSQLIDNGEVIGAALRTQTGIKPVFVSVGHKMSLQSACDWILKLAPSYRLPETTRLADQAVNQARKQSSLR